ncbi:flagellin [Vibrio mediterranei]|uniref:flagellin N-terminal helical domain-containing protein n=2 Tax=Vibrio mediterranei TaxID=689 RepID=UPI00148CB431|nr:flagellin [Vibrio mediterranei]
MAISVHTNYANLVTQNTLQSTNNALTKSMERLSTGFRINSAADDAAGLQIANRLNLQSRGLNVAMRNSQDAISMMQTAEGAMDEMTNIAYRMSDLATQAANGTYSDEDREALDAEFGQLASELSNIFNNTNFGGKSLLTGANSFGGAGGVTFQIGDKAVNTLNVDLGDELTAVSSFTTGFNATFAEQRAAATADFQAEADNFATGATTTVLGDGATGTGITGTYDDFADLKAKAELDEGTAAADLAIVLGDAADSVSSRIAANDAAGGIYDATGGGSGLTLTAGTEYADLMAGTAGTLSISSQSAANTTIDEMSTLINNIGEARAKFGANINRLDHTITNLGNITENLETSKGRIMDTDFAYESGMMSKSQMLMQSGASMLSASKMVPQLAMSLLG